MKGVRRTQLKEGKNQSKRKYIQKVIQKKKVAALDIVKIPLMTSRNSRTSTASLNNIGLVVGKASI
ncbi:hypothetical protein D3C73_1550180 [compost metagenome]